MHDHAIKIHKDEEKIIPEDFKMELINVDKDPNRRIVREAISIKHTLDGRKEIVKVKKGEDLEETEELVEAKLMNGKREFFLPCLTSGVGNIRDKM